MKKEEKIAEICGIHAGDGYLRNDGRRVEWDISGNIEEKNYYDKEVIPLFNKIFDLNIKGRFFKGRNTYGFVIRNKKIIEFAHKKLEFPYGSKSLIVKIPNFILNKKPLLFSFLRGYFDTDGHMGFTKKTGNYSYFKRNRDYYPRIMFTTVSKNLSRDLQRTFGKLGFKFMYTTHKPKRKTENLRYIIHLNGVKNLERWIDLIGTKNNTKYSRFLIWKNFGFCPTKTTYVKRLEILKNLVDPNSLYGPVV